jgi:hypothetical protein
MTSWTPQPLAPELDPAASPLTELQQLLKADPWSSGLTSSDQRALRHES